MSQHTAFLAAVTLVACWACAPINKPNAFVVRDSATIRIVENTTPLWQEGKEWHLSAVPVVDIGEGGGPDYELFRVGSAFRLNDGRIAIANRSTNDIRIFDEHGTHLLTLGGTGSGPGEFTTLMWAGRFRGDSLAAYQSSPALFAVFDEQGKVQRTTPIDLYSRLVGIAQDGSLFVITGVITRYTWPEGVIRDSLILFRAAASQPPWDSVGTYTGNEMLYQRTGGRNTAGLPLFPRLTDIVVHGAHFYVAENDAYEIRRHGIDGRLQMIIRRKVQPASVREEHVEALLTVALARYTDPNLRRSNERALRNALPATLPVFGPLSTEWVYPMSFAISVDVLGNVWVNEYREPGGNERPKWSVFAPDGVWLGEVGFPARFGPLDIGADYVLGLWRDADDVEHVRMYELVKP